MQSQIDALGANAIPEVSSFSNRNMNGSPKPTNPMKRRATFAVFFLRRATDTGELTDTSGLTDTGYSFFLRSGMISAGTNLLSCSSSASFVICLINELDTWA